MDDITNWLQQENEKVQLRNELKDEMEALEGKHSREIQGIKKERGQAIDKLRKEMLFNIRNVKG